MTTERVPFRFGGHRVAADATAEREDDPLLALGYARSPFPEPGLDTGAFYVGHMEPQVEIIERWVSEADIATRFERPSPSPIRPLAIRGSIGVGKTHVLKALEKTLASREDLAVTRKSLPEEGMERILLANLLLHNIPLGNQDANVVAVSSSVPLIDRIVLAANGNWRSSIMNEIETLRPNSLLAQALLVVIESQRDEYRTMLARWLSRGVTTPGQRAKLNLARPLEGEGQSIRAIADLLRIARAAREIQVWFTLIDQLEDLWRPGVISAGRRARLLTDLRFLVDLALEGAPIAVLLAWNTEVNAEDHIQVEYQALWRRLGTPVDLPGLGQKDVWPFAHEYLSRATTRRAMSELKPLRERFRATLEAQTPRVIRSLKDDPQASLGSAFASHRVLHHWRIIADEIAAGLRSG